MANDIFTAGRAFLDREGRLIERRLAAVLFDGADPSGVVDAVRAYRNPDGGFGHGLEPDKRCPASLPIDVDGAVDILLLAGVGGTGGGATDWSGDVSLDGLVLGACDWLGSVAAPDGGGAVVLPGDGALPPGRALVGLDLHARIEPDRWADRAAAPDRCHPPQLDRATDWCWARLESAFDEDAHALREVLVFLAHVPDRGRAEAVGAHVGAWLAKAP